MKHYCRWLKDKTGKALLCWQEGNKVKKSECTPCLLAYVVSSQYTNPNLKKRAS